MLLAEGAVDLAAEPELELYDMAALDVIVREAGGRFSSLDGTPGPNGGNALASNGRLHDQALAFLGSLPDDADDPDVAPRRPGSLHDLSSRRRSAAQERPDHE
jgi:histidinol-phosphatase